MVDKVRKAYNFLRDSLNKDEITNFIVIDL